MTNPNPAFLTARQASDLIGRGELTAEALARACLDRIAARDGTVRAWTHVDPDRVLYQARELDRGPIRGALHGIPIGVKDVILTRDMPTQYNSPVYEGFHPRIDASCIMTLRAAGALILGKTDTVEFASQGRRAVSRNPHDPSRTPGGSSSGSGAAVGDFHVPVALGTQTGGSTIRPSSFCGVYAMKPTWNAVSREGLKNYSATLDTLGWYGRSVEDLELLADAFAIQDDDAIDDRPVSALRIGVCRTPSWDAADGDAQQRLFEASETLRAAGVAVADIDLPPPFDGLTAAQNVIMRSEGRAAFLGEYRHFGERLHADFRRQVENADNFSRADQLAAYDLAGECRVAFDRIAAPFDAVLTLSAPGEATPGLATTGNALFNRMWTALHVPCVGFPAGKGDEGMPIGLTLTGARFRDRRVLATARALAPLVAAPVDIPDAAR